MSDDARGNDLDHQIGALTEIVGSLAATIAELGVRIGRLEKATRPREQGDSHQPAAWVWYPPPNAAEDNPDTTGDPRLTVDNFNITYAGAEGSRAKPIPDCWRKHPGLAMEIATLAYSWRAANIGSAASLREAQYWHHQWRPGFTDASPANGPIPTASTAKTAPRAQSNAQTDSQTGDNHLANTER